MAAPVWVLSVDLQTKTATFTTGLADAARSARGSFGEIAGGAGEMAHGVGKGSIDVRHSLGLVDNVIRGAHAQAMADLVRMYAQSALVMTTLPIAATAAGLVLIGGIAYEVAEHIKKLKEEQEKLGIALTEQNTAGNNAFRSLDADIIRAEQRSDELRNDHLGALSKQLELIDHQSMDELVKSFGFVQKAADAVFKELQEHWYTLGSGSTGPAHALNQFKIQYENLLSAGKDKEASDLLHGTLDSAQKILQLQQTINSNHTGTGLMGPELKNGDAYYAAMGQLRARGVGYAKDEVEAQKALVDGLLQQVGIESRVHELKKIDSGNAGRSAGNEAAQRRAAAAKEAVEAQVSMGQAAITGEKATADAQLTIHRASIEERLQSDLDFASREYQMKTAANQLEIAGLNKTSNDYQLQLKTLHDKALTLEAQYGQQRAELTSRATIAANERDVQAVETGIRERIEATSEGDAERLAAIDAGIREEQARHLQDTSFYRGLLTQRVSAARQATDQEAKLRADAAREAATSTERLGEMTIAAEQQQMALANSSRRVTDEQRLSDATWIANEEYAIKMRALKAEEQGLDTTGKDFANKLKQLQNKETQLTQQHENELTAIKERAAIERNQRVLAAETQFQDSIARGLTQSIMGHETWSRMLLSFGDQVVGGMIQNAIKSMVAEDMTKEKDAAHAARKAFNLGLSIGGPAGLILGPVFGASAFAAVMAFERGTDRVPGVGMGDVIPAMLTPGEGVVPGGVMDGLRNVARNGGFEPQGPQIHIHGVQFAPKIHAMDADGVDRVLTEHESTFQRHFENTLRRMNR